MKKGTIDNWRITRVDADSLTVEKHSRQGVIRRSELSHFRITEDLTKRFHEGESIKAMILEVPPHGLLILSVKDLDDPAWEKFYKEYKTGEIVYGRVLRVQSDEGTLIQLEQNGGVIGIIPPSEEIEFDKTFPILIAGDKVRAIITDFNVEQKCAVLSIRRLYPRKYNTTIHSHTTIGDIRGDELKLYAFRHGFFGQHPYDSEIMKLKQLGIQTILFCDDDTIVCKSYQNSFQSAGFETIIAKSGEEGIEKSKNKNYELAIIDLHMDRINGCDVAEVIQRTDPSIKIIITTGINNFNNYGYASKLSELNLTHNILRKPFTIRGIVQKLEERQKFRDENINFMDESIVDSIGEILKGAFQLEETLSHTLNLIKSRFSSSAVCLFRALSVDPEVELFAHAGDFPTHFDNTLLNHSPIKDVLVEQNNINQFELPCHAESPGKYYSNLCKIYPCKALMARPLRIQGEHAYALFVFSKIAQPEWHLKSELFSALAESIATAIERKILEQKFIQHQQFYIKGQISSSLIHELKNEELIISNSILQLERLVKLTEDKNFHYSNTKFLVNFLEAVHNLLEYDERITKIHKIFLTLLRDHETTKIDFEDHLDLLCRTLQYFAKEKNVTIVLKKDSQNITNFLLNITYLDNILTNLIINAIEQTALLSIENGEVQLSFEFKMSDKYPIKIRVSDNGPGIHQVHHEQIFELLFTSKKEGSGMGLYISQALARALGGKLQIESTCRFEGTTMLLELPYQKEKNL